MTNLLILIGAYVVFFNLLGAALWWAHLRFWKRLSVSLPYEAVEQLLMPDGGTIELRRVGRSELSHAEGESSTVPVLMVHGLAMNHRNHDTAEDASLARYLRKQGRDVWLLTLRSGRPSRSLKRPLEWLYGPAQSDFAAMVKYDLPIAVHEVLARTGQPQLDFAGFSMGGMLLYAGLDRTVDSKLVRRAALFASPARVRPLGALSLSRFLPAALAPSVPIVLMTRSFAFFPRLVPSFLWRRLYNPRNVDAKVERSMLWDVWEDIPGRLGNDFVRWSTRGGELTVDGVPVLPGLANVNVPACFFAGSVDWLAPLATVHAGFDAWGKNLPDLAKHFVVLGRSDSGTCDEYGHCDIAFGRNAQKEVFEPAARFLASGQFRMPKGAHAVELDTDYETVQGSLAE